MSVQDALTPPEISREHDGYFAPDSISWRIFADPVSKLGGMAALLLQALNPHMMRLFYNATASHDDSAGRDERTGQYFETVIFGDRAHADAASAAVRRLHERAVWTDPDTGEQLRADKPEWLAWTHNTFVFTLLRASREFGVDITPEEGDRFVVEQQVAARLIGIEDESLLPSTEAELATYIDAQTGWLALGIEAAEVTRQLRKPVLRGNPLKVWTAVIVQDGVLHLLPDWARLLYGIEGRPMNLRKAARTTRHLMAGARRSKTYQQLVDEASARVQEHPYRKVRSRAAVQ